MQNISQAIRVGLFFVFGLVLIWTMRETLVGKDGLRHSGYALSAVFDDLQQLRVGDEIRLAGVKVGHVRSTGLVESGKAQAILQIENNYPIPVGSVATIMTAGLLGSNYVAIIAGKGPEAYKDGEQIISRKTADINAVIASFGDVGDKLGEAFSTFSGTEENPGLFKNLNQLIVDNRSKIDSMLTNIDDITHRLSHGEGTLGLLINERSLYDQMMAAAKGLESVGGVTADLKTLLAKVDQGDSALGVLMSDPKAAADLKRTLANLADFSEKLNSDKSTLGKLVSDDSLYVHAQQMLNRADSALGSMTDSAPISAVGVAAAALF